LEATREHVHAQFVDQLELLVHACLQADNIRAQNSLFGKVEDLLGQKSEDAERIFTFVVTLTGTIADVGNKVLPRGRPLKLDDGDESAIKFG